MNTLQLPENVEVVEHQGMRWVSIEQPTKEALNYLKQNYNFHVLNYEDIITTTHRSKIDKYPTYVFLIVLFPLLHRKLNTINGGEIDFFLGKDFLVTIHRGDIPTFVDLFQLCEASDQARASCMGSSPQYLLYKILQRLFQYCYPILDTIDSEIDHVEEKIFETKANVLHEILVVRHKITDMRRIIQPHRQTLLRLQKPLTHDDEPEFELEKKYEDYFDDVRDYTQEIWNQLESFKESAEALHETNQSLISYRINDVIKTLTIFSAVMLPAGVVASLFGMNAVSIPFHGRVNDFYIFAGLTVLAMVATMWYIRHKRLL